MRPAPLRASAPRAERAGRETRSFNQCCYGRQAEKFGDHVAFDKETWPRDGRWHGVRPAAVRAL